MYDLIIKNGTVVTKEWMKQLDIGIANEKIAAIGLNLDEQDAKIIDAGEKLIFPGGVDCHAHLNEPGYTWREDYEHGTKSAAAGGVTTIVDMPLQNTPALIDKDAFQAKAERLHGKSYVDYSFWGGLIDNNLDQIDGMYQCGAAALKAFISPASPDFPSSPLSVVYQAMKRAAKLDFLLGFHCEDYGMISYNEALAKKEGKNSWRDYLDARPVIAEELAVQNILDMAKETGARIHICHVSHPKAAERIRKAKKQGVRVTAETCVHYLIYSEEDLIINGGLFKCSPPLRTEEAAQELWDYVLDGTLSCIVSDHSPAALYEKSADLSVWDTWGGISGLQTGLQLMYEYGVNQRGISPCVLAGVMAENAACHFGLKGKGKIEVGYDADLVIFDPKKRWEITEESLYYLNPISAFSGLSGHGLPETVLVRGEKVYDNGRFSMEKHGKLIRLKNAYGH